MPLRFLPIALLFVLAAVLAAPAHAQVVFQPGGVFGTYPGPAGPTTQPAQQQAPTPPVITNVPSREQQQRDLGRPTPPPIYVPMQPGFQPQIQALPEPEERNEFQEFIFASTGKILPIFGQSLFREVPSTFAPVDNVPVTPDYVVGPGDELYVRAWGQIDIDYRVMVDRNGTISIPRIGVINVAGIKYQDLTAYVKNAVSRVFRGFELTVTLGQLRSIQIFVVGQARRPGSYTVSSLSTLVNAIFAAGGPSNRGSMRSIQLKRGEKTVTDLDLYDLLVYGDKSKDAQLLPGDVIHVSPIGPLAAVTGSINSPAIYELKGATSLEKLVEWSGGLATTAQTRLATIERIDERRTRVVDKFSLDTKTLARAIRDGDLVTVFQVPPRFENAVTLRGNVAVPLRHPYTEGMRVRDLIPDKEALITYDYYRRINRTVQTEFLQERIRSGIETTTGALERRDLRDERSGLRDDRRDFRDDRRDLRDDRSRDLRDERRDLRDERRDGRDMGDLRDRRFERRISPEKLFAEINWDYAVIERLNEVDLTTTLVPFNLGKAILEGDPAQNLVLKPGDIVTIFSKEDINVPVARQTKLVRLEGEFNHAGVYQAQSGETIRQLIARAGDLSPGAYLFGAEFTRESVRAQQQKSYQETLNRIERDMQLQSAERARSAIAPEDAEAIKISIASQQATIARLRELKPTGRVVLELREDSTLADLPDVALEDGDRIFVPNRPAMVNVFGAVFTEGSFLHRPGRGVNEYIALAGGATRRADKAQIFVLRADGSAAGQTGGVLGLGSGVSGTITPGDTIVVPEDYYRTTFTRDLKDWTQIFYQFGLGAAALQVIRNR